MDDTSLLILIALGGADLETHNYEQESTRENNADGSIWTSHEYAAACQTGRPTCQSLFFVWCFAATQLARQQEHTQVVCSKSLEVPGPGSPEAPGQPRGPPAPPRARAALTQTIFF